MSVCIVHVLLYCKYRTVVGDNSQMWIAFIFIASPIICDVCWFVDIHFFEWINGYNNIPYICLTAKNKSGIGLGLTYIYLFTLEPYFQVFPKSLFCKRLQKHIILHTFLVVMHCVDVDTKKCQRGCHDACILIVF